MGQKIGTMRVLCGLTPNQQVNLNSYNGRPYDVGGIKGITINARIEGNCVVVDVERVAPGPNDPHQWQRGW